MRPLNVLMLLAGCQLPHPDNEIEELERLSALAPSGMVYFAATRPVSGLTPNESQVAFYGDIARNYELLGAARFRGFVSRGTPDWDLAIQTHKLYRYGYMPETCLGFIAISNVMARSGDVGSLCAVLEDGRRLDNATVSELDEHPDVTFGTKISSIYFLDERPGPPTPQETIALLRAKRDELEGKILYVTERWKEQEQSAQRAREDARAVRTELKDERAPSGSDELLDRAKPRHIRERFDELTRGHFPRLGFCHESHLTLRQYAAGQDNVWRVLGELNDRADVSRYEIQRIAGTKHWWEIKPARGLRIYFRRPPSASDGKMPVLVGRKSRQTRTDIPYLKSNDQP